MMNEIRQFIVAAGQGGLQIHDLIVGKWARCKVDGDRGGKRSGAYRYFDDKFPGGIWWNWKTGAYGTWTARQDMTPTERIAHHQRIAQAECERKAEQMRQWDVSLARNRQALADAKPITSSDPVGRYLESRGFSISRMPNCLHYAPSLPYYDDGVCQGHYPAMLAAVVGSDNRLVSVHRTYLTPYGDKANVPITKKLSPASGPLAGAAIRIGRPQARPDGVALAVAEGIETALAVTTLHGIPCWAAVSANGMKAFEWPTGVTMLFVMGDHDASGTGQAAAQALAQRAAAHGVTARVCIPETIDTDWADVLAASERGMR